MDWYNAWGKEQAAVEGELAAAYSKLEEAAARFALLHHVVSKVARTEDDLTPVKVESVEAGITLARWFAREARRIYATLSESEEARDTRRLVEFIQSKGGTITIRALRRSNSRKYPKAEHAEDALDLLAEAGFGEWVEPVPTERGGQPARRFVLHATPDSTDTTASEGENEGDEGPPPLSDTTSDSTPPTSGFLKENWGSVGRRAEGTASRSEPVATEAKGRGNVRRKEVVSEADTGAGSLPNRWYEGDL